MTEQQRKYEAFEKEDLAYNGGLIVNQMKEVADIMEHPNATTDLQKEHLKGILEYAIENTEFYRPYSNYSSILDFPVISKMIIKENMEKIQSNEYRGAEGNVIQKTSGSTGTPFSVIWDHTKHCRLIADMKYYAHQGGVESHERIVCIHAFRKMGNSSKEKQERDNCYNVYYSCLDDSAIESLLEEVKSFSPKMIVGYSSMLEAIANYIYEGKAGKCEMQLTAIMSEAEFLKERTRKILEKYFDCPVYSRYGNMECGIMAQEDGSGLGHRLNIASYYFEILSLDSDKPVKDGEIGRVVITDLYNRAMPMIRYDTNDLAIKITTDDGRVYLKELAGRQNDALYTTGGQLVNQHHIVIYSSMFQDVKQFQFIQETEKKYTCLLVTENHSYEEQLLQEFKNTFGEDGEYSIQYVDEIPALPSGKIQMTVCKLHKQ